ncbi:MAG: type 1 glutamine amidotransferase [Pseudomonadota bacterium]
MDRLLLMDGNPLDRQQTAVAGGSRSPGMVYEDMLVNLFPDMQVDRVNAAEPGDVLPANTALADYDGLVIAGSSLHAYDGTPEITRQIDLARAFGETGKPVLGSCWGLQIAVLAAGGDIRRCDKGRELIFSRDIALTAEGRAHFLFTGKPDSFDAPCIHLDEVSVLPDGAVVLASNDHSHVQAATFTMGKSIFSGVQYHPEFDLRHLADLVHLYADMMNEEHFDSDAERVAYHDKLRALSARPSDGELADALAVDAWILEDRKRGAEVINWVGHYRSA